MWQFIVLAQNGGPGGGGGCFAGLVPLVLIFLIFWFIVIRPEQKKQQDHKDFLDALKVGDQVVTAGGIFGEVTKIDDDTVKLRINRGNPITVLRQQIKGPQEEYLGADEDEKEQEKEEEEAKDDDEDTDDED